ncbi:hypothetical protein DL93DRAFT_2226795 [Clavulina sp. PMI_390]|nr:hypothetical protein DL93DRAFT_2226795 [Clavulina sp. PMI_390]
MPALGRLLIFGACLVLLHATFATYDHLTQLKALNQLNDTVGTLPSTVILECFASLAIFILGATLNTEPLKEITWASEMSRRSIDEMDARVGFATVTRRPARLFRAQE